MLVISSDSTSILAGRVFKKNEPYKYEAQQWEGSHVIKFNKGNELPATILPHVPQGFYLTGFVHWLGTNKPNHIVIFDQESLAEINKYFESRRRENAAIMWYFAPQSTFTNLKKEIAELEKKAQAEKTRKALEREQKRRTAQLAKSPDEKSRLVNFDDDEFGEEKTEDCCCKCWWR